MASRLRKDMRPKLFINLDDLHLQWLSRLRLIKQLLVILPNWDNMIFKNMHVSPFQQFWWSRLLDSRSGNSNQLRSDRFEEGSFLKLLPNLGSEEIQRHQMKKTVSFVQIV